MSPWKQFVSRWQNCTACPLHQCRKSVVLARGNVPCDVLFIGEAPGISEDAIGRPFVGPAGHLLDQIVAEALKVRPDWEAFLAFTNIICCIPKDELNAKIHEPPDYAVKACAKRLTEFVQHLAKPKAIVFVGKHATNSNLVWNNGLTVSITHPAAILRANVAAQPLMLKQAIVILENLFESL